MKKAKERIELILNMNQYAFGFDCRHVCCQLVQCFDDIASDFSFFHL